MSLALGVVLSAGVVRAQDECIGFLEQPVDGGGLSGADAVFAADIDGDGDIDVLSASHGDNKIAWFENKLNLITNEVEFVIEHVITTDAQSASSIFAVDIDGDGDMDVLSASRDDNIVAWYDNDGSTPAGFRKRIVTSELRVPLELFVADVDGDGDPDVVTASFNDNRIAWHENQIGQQGIETQFAGHVIAAPVCLFEPETTCVDLTDCYGECDFDNDGELDGEACVQNSDCIDPDADPVIDPGVCIGYLGPCDPHALGAASVFAADIDGDGDIDVAAASRVDNTVAWYEQQVDAQTSEITFVEHVLTTAADGATSVRAADLDGDGNIDIVAASHADDTLRWFVNDGNTPPNFVEGDPIATDAAGPRSVFIADIDGDGDQDVLLASDRDDTVAWYENDGNNPPSFVRNVLSSVAVGASGVFAADLDGDTDADVLSISSATGTTMTSDKLAWYDNDGAIDPTLTEKLIAATANGALSVKSADFDGDGIPDLVVGRSEDPIAWYDNDGAATPTFSKHEVVGSRANATEVLPFDINADSHVDILAAYRDDDTVVWYESDGNDPLAFTEHVVTTTADGVESVFAADVDGDGHLDVLSASFDDNKIAWYESDGNDPPTFTEHVITASVCLFEPETTCADTVDCEGACDGDGDACVQDFDCIDHGGEQVCTGGLGPCLPQADGARGVFAADVDGDGDIDILSASSRNSRISWWENDDADPPGFTQHAFVLGGARTVVAGDIDGDGDTDIAGASTFGTISWWNNRDDSDDPLGFTEIPVALISGVDELELIDFDLDGATDLITMSPGATRVAWFQNNPASATGFTAHTVPGTAVEGRSVAVADLNGDMNLDFAVGYRAEVAWYEQLDEFCQTFDADNDGNIDGIELSWLARAFGSISDNPMAEWWFSIDFNRDGVVDGDDLSILASIGVWGRTTETCNYACQ